MDVSNCIDPPVHVLLSPSTHPASGPTISPSGHLTMQPVVYGFIFPSIHHHPPSTHSALTQPASHQPAHRWTRTDRSSYPPTCLLTHPPPPPLARCQNQGPQPLPKSGKGQPPPPAQLPSPALLTCCRLETMCPFLLHPGLLSGWTGGPAPGSREHRRDPRTASGPTTTFSGRLILPCPSPRTLTMSMHNKEETSHPPRDSASFLPVSHSSNTPSTTIALTPVALGPDPVLSPLLARSSPLPSHPTAALPYPFYR